VLGHLSERNLTRYRNRELSPAEILELDRHLANCGHCQVEIRGRAESEETAAQIVTALRAATSSEDNHLSYEQMADYVDHGLGEVDRELCDSHLEFCASCSAEVRDLLAMKDKLAELPDTRYSPREAGTLWNHLATWWLSPAIRIPVLSATAAVIVALLVWAVILYSRKKTEEAHVPGGQPEKVASVTPAPSPTGSSAPQDQTDVRMVVELIDGDHKVSLDSQDKLSGLESAPPQIQNEVRSALKSEHVKSPLFIAGLKGEPGTLMGTKQAEYGLLSPVATAVESKTPTFRWTAVKGVDNYEVAIYDAGSKKVLTSGLVLKNIWKAAAALERGHNYSWQVRAIKDGREVLMPPPGAPDAKFRIVEPGKMQEIQLARKSDAKSYLVLGVVYAEAGMIEESERAFQKLLNANPNSPVARSLLRSVKALRR